jgi:hypothetical protein
MDMTPNEKIPVNHSKTMNSMTALAILVASALLTGQQAFGEDYSAKSVEDITKAAESGDNAAEYALGQLYDDGFKLPRDPEKVRYWYRRAAEHGNFDAWIILSDKTIPKPRNTQYDQKLMAAAKLKVASLCIVDEGRKVKTNLTTASGPLKFAFIDLNKSVVVPLFPCVYIFKSISNADQRYAQNNGIHIGGVFIKGPNQTWVPFGEISVDRADEDLRNDFKVNDGTITIKLEKGDWKLLPGDYSK